jgi:hypothetical protein
LFPDTRTANTRGAASRTAQPLPVAHTQINASPVSPCVAAREAFDGLCAHGVLMCCPVKKAMKVRGRIVPQLAL